LEEILTGKKQGGIKSHSVACADEKLPNLAKLFSQYNAPSVSENSNAMPLIGI
jgi:hypothetical protein